jgi:hypothetical protein
MDVSPVICQRAAIISGGAFSLLPGRSAASIRQSDTGRNWGCNAKLTGADVRMCAPRWR